MASFAEWSNKKKKEREESQNASTLGKETSQGPSASKPASFGEWSNQKKGITYVYDGKHYATERDARQAMTANTVNKPASDKASAGTDLQQTSVHRPVTVNRPASINRYMSTEKRNALHQSVLEEAKAQEVEQARQAEAKAQAKLDSAKRVQAQRSGLNQRKALPAEKDTEESATLAHRTAGLRGPVDPEQAARNEAVRLAEDQALRDAYRETYGEEAPEKSVWNQIKLASAANLSGLTKAGQGLINTADFVVNLIPRMLEDTGLVENATDNPVSNAMQKLVEMGQRDAETWDREVAKYSAAQGTTAGKIAGFQEMVMQNAPQTVIDLMKFFATGGASAAAALGAPVQGVLPMVQKAVKELAKKPDFWYSFITQLGNNYQEALNQGADNDRATVAALTASLANAEIEVGGISGEGGLETLLQKIGGGQGAMVSWLLSLPEEGLEEVLQGITTRATNAAMFKGDTPLYGQGGVFDKEAAKDEFGSGMAVAAVLGGAQIGANALLNKAGAAIRNKQLDSNNTDPVMEQAMQLLQEKMGTENAPVLPTQSAQETIERTDDKTVTRQSNPVLKLLEKGRASAETLAAKSKGDEGFWNQVDELVNSGQASFDEGGNLYLVNAEDHIDNRTSEYVGNQQVKSFQYLHPELHEYYAKAAQGLLKDLEGSTKASRYQTVETGVGMDTKWQGERRITVEPIARLLDNYGFTYAEVKQGLEDIIQNHGSENYAKAKRLEMVLDDIMTEGYTDIDGMQVEPNQAYIQAKAGIAGAADQYVTDASPDVPDAAGAPAITRDAQTIANDVYRVNRAAAALGENGSKALSAVYGNEEISSRYTPEEIVQGFYEVYNEAMTGEAMSEDAKMRAAALPESVRYAAESSGQRDALRAEQAKYFGKDAQLVRDENWKKAHLSSKDSRKLDALAKVLGVKIRFADKIVVDAEGHEANAQYLNGEITLSLNAKDPVMTSVIHESVHRLREASPSDYTELSRYVLEHMSDLGLSRSLAVRRELYETGDRDTLTEEMVCDAYGVILENGDLLEQFAADHRSIAQKIADAFRDAINAIKRALNNQNLKLTQAQKDEFIELRGRLHSMEQAMRNALKTVEKTGSQAYNDGNKTQVKHSRKTPGFNNERSLSHDELASVYEYKASESYKLNGLLLAGAKLDDRYIKMRDNLDTALEKLPVHTGKVYRNLVFDDFDGQAGLDDFMSLHHVGVPVNYGAYASSSKTPDGHPAVGEYVVNLEIESATGRDMEGFGNNFEEEVLFGREAWFIPTKITVGADGNPLIVMKEEVVYGTGVHTGRNDRHSGRAGAVQQGAETSEASRGEVRDVRAVQDGNPEVQGASRGHSQRGAERGRTLSEVSKENVKYSLKAGDTTQFSLKSGDEGATFEENGVKYSIKSLTHDITEGRMFDDLVTAKVFTVKEADLLKKNLDKLVSYMIPNAQILDMNEEYSKANRPYSAYKPNSDPLYVISLDFSTLCRKRLMTQYVIEQLQLKENRPMSAEEQIAIRSMLLDYRQQEQALQVACAMCYVEAARLKAPKQMERFFKDTESIMRKYFAKKDKDFNDKVKAAQTKFKVDHGYAPDATKKDMTGRDTKALNDMSAKMRKEYVPDAKQQAIIDTAVKLPRSTFLTAGNLTALAIDHPDIYAAYTDHIRASTRSKSLESDIPYYYGDSRGMVSDSFIEGVNAENGMRFDSWSDFQMKHMLDMITAVIDLSVRGSKMHGYTKFPEMVRIFGKTGMMFNLSGVTEGNGFDSNGDLLFSRTEGIDIDEARKLLKDFPETAGLQCIGVSDEHIRALLRADYVDYVIPYHTSGMNATLRKMAGIHAWKDYTDVQHARKDPNAKKPANAEKWQVEPVWSEFYVQEGKDGFDIMQKAAQRYIDLCHDRGLIPKFDKFMDEPGYWKLLVDRKMVNQVTGEIIEQKPVKPIFDFDLIKQEIDREVSQYDPQLEKRALKYVVDNFDAVHQRIRDLKKGHPKKPMLKMANEILQAYAEGSKAEQKNSRSNRELLDNMISQYGAIPKGEKPARDILLPTQTQKGKNVSRTVRTILEAKATPDELVPNVEKLVASGDLSFDSYTDEQAMADADSRIRNVGWAKSLSDWMQVMDKGEVSKANTAMGWALYNNAANSQDTETALTILNKMVLHQRSAAQALQATRILKKLSPETQLYQVQRSIASLQEELNERYGTEGAPELVIDKDLAEAYLKAKEQEERDAILRDIYRDIGRQMPSRFMDKWNAWRYLAMLGNPRTHVRNIVGNLGFAPVVAAKNLTATAIESVVSRVSGGKLNRTKAIVGTGKHDRALLKAAWSDYDKVQEAALSGGKYSDLGNANKYIEEGRQIFRFKPLDAARKGNSKALDVEDVWFSKPHYAFALASYCKAHNISESEIAKGGKALHKARAYAVLEAQKATYRDTNALSQTISSFGRGTNAGKNPVKKGVNLLLEGILPFRKTPANILSRGIEYSPIGLMNGIKQAVYDVQKGTKTGAEAIDSISAGLTGTGLMALGIYLAAQGLIRGHGSGDEDENEFEELQGHQAYALELPDGTSVTLDWLAPEALPLFVGVNLYEQTGGEAENATMSTILSAVGTVSEPLLEMSCLQSLNDVFDSVGNATNDGLKGLPAALVSSATSYLTQGLPTLLGQIERTGEYKRYTTYTSKNAFLTRDMQYTVGRASARIPGWDYQQIPYIDAWGRTEATGNTGAKAFNNFVNPAYTSEISTSDMEKELQRLFDETGEAGVLPSIAAKYFTVDGERKDLTAEEYIQYATLKGQTAYETLTDLVESKQYRAMTDDDKVKAVKNAYDYANQTAKAAISEYQTDSWMQKADEAEKKYGISQEMYISIRTNASGLKSLKDADGNTITNSLSLLKMKLVYDTPGLNEKQRQAMFEYLGVGKKVQHYNKALVEQKLQEMRKKAQ